MLPLAHDDRLGGVRGVHEGIVVGRPLPRRDGVRLGTDGAQGPVLRGVAGRQQLPGRRVARVQCHPGLQVLRGFGRLTGSQPCLGMEQYIRTAGGLRRQQADRARGIACGQRDLGHQQPRQTHPGSVGARECRKACCQLASLCRVAQLEAGQRGAVQRAGLAGDFLRVVRLLRLPPQVGDGAQGSQQGGRADQQHIAGIGIGKQLAVFGDGQHEGRLDRDEQQHEIQRTQVIQRVVTLGRQTLYVGTHGIEVLAQRQLPRGVLLGFDVAAVSCQRHLAVDDNVAPFRQMHHHVGLVALACLLYYVWFFLQFGISGEQLTTGLQQIGRYLARMFVWHDFWNWPFGYYFTQIGVTLAIVFAGTLTATVLALLLCAGWNNTAYYPSVADLQSSLTIGNSCSSPFTLEVMSYVSILVPFVLGYIFYAWRALDLRKISGEEMQEKDTHAY